MIAGIVSRQQAVGVFGITRDLVEVDEGVEMTRSADPFVDGLTIRFRGRAGMIERSADKGRSVAPMTLIPCAWARSIICT